MLLLAETWSDHPHINQQPSKLLSVLAKIWTNSIKDCLCQARPVQTLPCLVYLDRPNQQSGIVCFPRNQGRWSVGRSQQRKEDSRQQLKLICFSSVGCCGQVHPYCCCCCFAWWLNGMRHKANCCRFVANTQYWPIPTNQPSKTFCFFILLLLSVKPQIKKNFSCQKGIVSLWPVLFSSNLSVGLDPFARLSLLSVFLFYLKRHGQLNTFGVCVFV